MRARDDAGGLTDAALRDEAMTLFLAGQETTALAITFTLRLLALHPEYQEEISAWIAADPLAARREALHRALAADPGP